MAFLKLLCLLSHDDDDDAVQRQAEAGEEGLQRRPVLARLWRGLVLMSWGVGEAESRSGAENGKRVAWRLQVGLGDVPTTGRRLPRHAS